MLVHCTVQEASESSLMCCVGGVLSEMLMVDGLLYELIPHPPYTHTHIFPRELGSREPRDLALDTSGTRCFASFLMEVAQLIPEAVLPTISVLLPHLSGEVRAKSPSVVCRNVLICNMYV